MRKSRAKFERGNQILNLKELLEALMAGRWLYWRHKIVHPKFLMNWSLSTLSDAAEFGTIRYAHPRQESK